MHDSLTLFSKYWLPVALWIFGWAAAYVEGLHTNELGSHMPCSMAQRPTIKSTNALYLTRVTHAKEKENGLTILFYFWFYH